mmetsp:Transcript_1241/g.2885  ORF Transcript_1241/g.2885 Transcript_1241/m.2885 type:complete len:234 (-) Transcript_1241:228-929(-)|eukprot:CAMPEP_0197583454 /NCGR_PEP_ID=MMETSP1326-20131121/6366_1 /TAXON_ID=1155430 /ORGANISM="Genus nov. species nov., Strain RCC2288" /LENGTH=233 /DNA_ID=CAMNT_0043147679 /DNA_START=176 /DNA_END=877 /DNA_ORIENTATION=-
MARFQTQFLCAAVVLALSLGSSSGAPATWKSCGDGSITITDVKLLPDPVQPGADAAFDVSATVAAAMAPVTGGNIAVDIKYNGMEIGTENVAVCATTACPTPGAAGTPISIKYTKTIPAFIPPGKYTISFKAADTTGAALFCVAVDFSVGIEGMSESEAGVDGISEGKEKAKSEEGSEEGSKEPASWALAAAAVESYAAARRAGAGAALELERALPGGWKNIHVLRAMHAAQK